MDVCDCKVPGNTDYAVRVPEDAHIGTGYPRQPASVVSSSGRWTIAYWSGIDLRVPDDKPLDTKDTMSSELQLLVENPL